MTKPPSVRVTVPVGAKGSAHPQVVRREELLLRLVRKDAGEPGHGAEDRRHPGRRRAAARDLGEHVALRLEVRLVAAEPLRRRHPEDPRLAQRVEMPGGHTSRGLGRRPRSRAASARVPRLARRALPRAAPRSGSCHPVLSRRGRQGTEDDTEATNGQPRSCLRQALPGGPAGGPLQGSSRCRIPTRGFGILQPAQSTDWRLSSSTLTSAATAAGSNWVPAWDLSSASASARDRLGR